MHGGVLEDLGDFCEVHFAFPDHQFALLELGPTDVLARGDLQVFMEQGLSLIHI